jgi:hypothetical protein
LAKSQLRPEETDSILRWKTDGGSAPAVETADFGQRLWGLRGGKRNRFLLGWYFCSGFENPRPPGTGAVGQHANTIGEAMGWSIEEYCARSIQGFAASKIGANSAQNFRQRVVASEIRRKQK